MSTKHKKTPNFIRYDNRRYFHSEKIGISMMLGISLTFGYMEKDFQHIESPKNLAILFVRQVLPDFPRDKVHIQHKSNNVGLAKQPNA
jgi:hypothetical protein